MFVFNSTNIFSFYNLLNPTYCCARGGYNPPYQKKKHGTRGKKILIEIINDRILKPSTTPSPPTFHAGANPTKAIPFTIFDKTAVNLHFPLIHAFLPPTPTNDALIQGLSKALDHYPHLAGRLSYAGASGQYPCILLNGAGIRLVEANVSSTLASALPLEPSEEMRLLHPPTEGVEELFQVQLNRYGCGGLVIGQTCHHCVCDGQSMSSFLLTWARLVKGMEVDPVPYHDRAAVSEKPT